MEQKRILVAAVLMVVANAARAQTLTTVIETLKDFRGSSSVRATIERQVASEQTDGIPEQGRTSFSVEADSAALSLSYATAEVRRAEAEGRERDPDKPRPVTQALESVDVVEIASYLNYSSSLLREIDGARVKRETATSHEGKPARLLELELEMRIPKAEAKHVKEARSTMKLWVAPDGTPLASEVASKFKARFLVISFEGTGSEVRRFLRSGDRLIVTREERRDNGSGIGRSMKRRTITTLRITS